MVPLTVEQFRISNFCIKLLHIAPVFVILYMYSKYSWRLPLQSCVFVKLWIIDPKMKFSSDFFT